MKQIFYAFEIINERNVACDIGGVCIYNSDLKESNFHIIILGIMAHIVVQIW